MIGLAISVDYLGDSGVLTLRGDLDHGNRAAFQEVIDRQLGQHRDLFLDCSGVVFMDAGGLNVMVGPWPKRPARSQWSTPRILSGEFPI